MHMQGLPTTGTCWSRRPLAKSSVEIARPNRRAKSAFVGKLTSLSMPCRRSSAQLLRRRILRRPRRWHLHPQVLRQKRPLVGKVIDLHPNRLTRAMTRAGLDTNEDRVGAELHGLQRGRELITVPGHDPVVVIGGR